MPQSGRGAIGVDMDGLYTRQHYVAGLDTFLSEEEPARALSYWLEEYEKGARLLTPQEIVNALNRTIARIDELINEQLNLILHHEQLQRLEASWRGLWYLVTQANMIPGIKIKVLDIAWPEVVRDIDKALEFDQSQLFRKIYSDEYDTPGGEPFGALIGDYEVSHRVSEAHPYDDISTLKGLAKITAAAFSPFVTSAASDLFGLESFSGLGHPLNLETIFSQSEYTRWRTLRDDPDTRFIGVTLPKILMRLPYRTRPGSYKGIPFHESRSGHASRDYLWGNACYGFGAILIREFASIGWFGHIRGVSRNQLTGGLLTTLPADRFETDAPAVAPKPVTDVIITDSVERELSELGFIPLCQCYDTPFAAFYNNQSLHRAQTQSGVNARLSAMLQHVLCGSRIAHYVKVIIRDKVGSFLTASDCEDYLRNWLFRYTTGREDLAWEEQARYPLRAAAVEVREHPAKPGQYLCVIKLQPHYQLDQMVSELELSTELTSLG